MQSFNDQTLIRQMILERYETPIYKVDENDFNFKEYQIFNHKSDSCIDNITVYLKIDNDIIIDARFSGIGCAISTASTDILCEMVINKNFNKVIEILDNYFNMIKQEKYNEEILENLYIFKNVGNQMNRIKCALVGVNSIKNIIDKKEYDK